MRILIVDDEPELRRAIRANVRRRFRVEVDEAGDGVEALQCLLRVEYDLAILDFNMPYLNGLDALRAIRRSPKHKSLPVVMLTGSSDETLVKAAVGLGVFGYLVKPVKTEALLARIHEILGRSEDRGNPLTSR